MAAARQSLLAVAGVLAATALAVLLLGWGAASGPHDTVTGTGHTPSVPAISDQITPSAGPVDTGDPTGKAEPSRGLEILQALLLGGLVVVAAGMAIGVAFVAVSLLRRLADAYRIRRRAVGPEQADFEVLTLRDRLADELAADAGQAAAALRTGTPRNAIVAVWLRFEELAAQAGVSREPWETAAEHTRRVLALAEADPVAVARLADLYREARFSRHELDEADRAAALAALDTLHSALAAR